MKTGSRRAIVLWVLIAVSPTTAATVFTLSTNTPGHLGSNEMFSADAISMMVSSDSGGRLHNNKKGLGLNTGSGDQRDLDGAGIDEQLSFSFSEDVVVTAIKFSRTGETEAFASFEGLGDTTSLAIATGTNVGHTLYNIDALLTAGSSFSIKALADNDYFRVASITVTAVPLPASAWLFSAAMGGLLTLRRRS
jgi:hypothetical protein